MQTQKTDAIALVELLLTAEIYNRVHKLVEADLPPDIRRNYFDSQTEAVRRPILVSGADAEKICGAKNVKPILADLPFVEIDGAGGLIRLAEFDAAAAWFASQDVSEAMRQNPVLAHYYQKFDPDVSYPEARVVNQSILARGGNLHARVEKLYGEESEELLKLVTIKLPEDVRNSLDDLVLTKEQLDEIAKAGKALEHRDYLKSIGLFEIGKILFVGPPGTGKTSSARRFPGGSPCPSSRSSSPWSSAPISEKPPKILITSLCSPRN